MKIPNILMGGQSSSDLFTQSLFTRPKSLTKYLPWDEFIKDYKFHLLKDGSLGVIFKINLLEHEPETSNSILAAVNSLKHWLKLPSNCTLQVLYDQSYISCRDKIWNQMLDSYDKPHDVSHKLFKNRIEQLKNAENGNTPLKRETLLSIRYFPEYMKNESDLKSGFRTNNNLLLKETIKFVKALKSFNSIVKGIESNSYIELDRLTAEEFISTLRRWFNPSTFYQRDFAPYNSSCSVSDQILFSSPILDFSGIEREGVKSKTLTLKTAPNFAYHGGMAYFTNLTFPFRLSLNISFPSEKKVNSFFDIKEFFLDKTQSAKGKRQLNEIREVKQKLANDDRGLFLTFTVIIEAEDDEILEDRVKQVANIFNNQLECEVIEEKDIGLGLYLNSLPLNYSPKADYSIQRFIRILRSDATKFIPIFDSFRGLKKPLQVFLSRENNLVNFNLLENQTSNHSVVVADTGSGKSAFIIDCIQAAKRMNPEPLVFVIDKKSSYKMLSEYFDGDLTIFGANNKIPFSPFRGRYDEQKISFLTNLISTALKLTSPNFQIESEHTAAITKSLKLAYLNKLDRAGITYDDGELIKNEKHTIVELTMEDFVSELASLTSHEEFEKLESSIEQLLNKLKPFYGDGIYAKYFNSITQSEKQQNSLFYIYDLDALDSDETLQVLMTMAVFEEIRQKIQLPENQARGGFIIIEELGMLGRTNPKASEFIIDAAETFRKLGFWLIALTPNPKNYFELDVGKAMWAAADNFIFLSLKPDNVEYLQENSSIIDEANSQILKSLRTIKGKYADIYYMNKDQSTQGAFRYVQTPLDRWLAPTNAKDNQEAQKAIKRFKNNKWEALEYLAETFPNGVN